MFVRQGSEADIPLLIETFNAWIDSFEPSYGTGNEVWAKEFLNGFPDQSPAWLFFDSENGVPFAQANLNPSSNAKRLQVDIQIRPDTGDASEVLDWVIAKADSEYPGYEFWVTTNKKDIRLVEAYKQAGLRTNRFFFSLRAQTPEGTRVSLPTGVSLQNLALESDDDMLSWYQVHQDAFSRHFGFVPRDAESWIAIQRRSSELPAEFRYLLKVEGEAAAIVIMSDELAHEDRSFVEVVAVKHEFQGRGLGNVLMQIALDHARRLNHKELELSVDSQNESGALRLYEKFGFTEQTTWVQFER